MNSNDNVKYVVSFSGNGLVFTVYQIGSMFGVAVRKFVSMDAYKVIDSVSCEDEAEARSVAWALSSPDGYTGL